MVGKEISLEDVRLALQKMSDRFFEHPATVLVLTNLAYADAPWLAVKSLSAPPPAWFGTRCRSPAIPPIASSSRSPIWCRSCRRTGRPGVSAKTGNPVYERPVVLVIYREDHKFLLDPIIPRPGGTMANYDLVIASQPYRARASLDFKVKRVIAPLARALGPGGRLIAIHSHGHDPGMEIIQKVWPGDNPFIHDRHQILKAVKQELGPAGRDLNFNAYADNRSLFRYDMHTLPSEISDQLDRHLDAVRGLERGDLCGAGRGRPARRGGRRRALSRGYPRRAARARRIVVLRRELRGLAPAQVGRARTQSNGPGVAIWRTDVRRSRTAGGEKLNVRHLSSLVGVLILAGLTASAEARPRKSYLYQHYGYDDGVSRDYRGVRRYSRPSEDPDDDDGARSRAGRAASRSRACSAS